MTPATDNRDSLIGLFTRPAEYEIENRKGMIMTACPRCDARFTGAPDIERQWIERHIGRHGVTRRALAFDGPTNEPRTLNTAA
jgi:uncharacterized C2H2 Zn-finger protein